MIGGTTEARKFSEFLNKENINYFYCAASQTGASLVNNNYISSQKLTFSELKDLVKGNGITHIFDLTHPYASEIKSNASQVAEILGIPYIFYTRPSKNITDNRIVFFKTTEEIIKYCLKSAGNIFLTTGTKNLEYWKNFNKNRLFVRTLPIISSIKKCEEVKIKPQNIIAEFGPFSYDENILAFKHFNIKYLVTKESGDEGGYNEKIQAALDLDIIPLVLLRPEPSSEINGFRFTDLKDLMNYAKHKIN